MSSHLLLVLLALGPAAAPQEPRPALEAARRAFAAGRLEEAAQHGLQALERAPHDALVLRLLLEISAGDPDSRALWGHELAARLADAKGKVVFERGDTGLLAEDDASAVALIAARAAAADDLADLAESRRKSLSKSPENTLAAHWAASLGREVVAGVPALRERWAEAFAPGFPMHSRVHDAVQRALERAMSSALSAGRPGEAIRAALILRGLAVQARFEDLKGPPAPSMGSTESEANGVLARARALLEREHPEPWTLDSLDALEYDQRSEFTREHASFANPAVGLSPRGWYRVETICGWETLAGALETVEDHHRRLASWFGEDPFQGQGQDRQGTVRLVPEAAGLESEGTGFWWAGGFQSGDLTVLRLSVSTIESLGRGLTHELTHRFDGALHPGIPSWLSEGRAVWTGAAYAQIEDEDFEPRYASFGTIEDTNLRGYGAKDKLEQLVSGTIDDYRDNYVAGFSLYVYLSSWSGEDPEAPLLFAGPLEQYMKSRRSDRRSPLEAFERHFCDGKDGRPEDFESFAKGFKSWISGFYWLDRKPWTERYVPSIESVGGRGPVLDEPTWTWSRSRAEPWFGQDQARAAGALFRGLDKAPEALRAYAWSLGVDERWLEADLDLLELCRELGRDEAAWIVENDLFRRGYREPPAERAPMLSSLSKVRALLDKLRATVESYTERGWTRAAAALAADHDRLAVAVGVARLVPGVSDPFAWNAPPASPLLHPFDRPAESLMEQGWREDELTGHDRYWVDGLWCVDEFDDLHVGRKTPRLGSGSADRGAGQHQNFVRTDHWQEPGRYELRLRLHPTSTFVAGTVVVGYTRRDRNLRFDFSAGDYMYSIGVEEEGTPLESVNWSLSGLRDRDGGLPGARPGGGHSFGSTVSSFELRLLVDEGALHAFIDGRFLGTYHTPDGAPIEGYLGFAVRRGSYKVADPLVRRLDRRAAYTAPPDAPAALELTRPRRAAFDDLKNHRVRGLQLSPKGSIVVWVPLPEPDDSDEERELDLERLVRRRAVELVQAANLIDRNGLPLPLVVALPAALDAQTADDLHRAFEEEAPELPGGVSWVRHGLADPAAQLALREHLDLTDARQSWLLFVDSAGILRAVKNWGRLARLEGPIERWIEVFRDR